ncbi:MAG: radical SAM protein [bacterium]
MIINNISQELYSSLKREYNYLKINCVDSVLFLTYRCTSKCKTCNIWKRNSSPTEELDWHGWKKILTKLKKYEIKTIELFGGDALLRKDILFKIIEFCSKNNIKTYFPTNSILLTKEVAKGLVESGLETIYFSLDDIEDCNDKIRGVDGSFFKVKRGFENVITARGKQKAPRIVVCVTISKMNYNHFTDIVNFLNKYKIDAIYPRVLGEFDQEMVNGSIVDGIEPEPFFASTDDLSHRLTSDQYSFFKKTLLALSQTKDNGTPFIFLRSFYDTDERIITGGIGAIRRCLLCPTVLTLNPDGEVLPCMFYKNYSLGNLISSDLEDIWGSDKHKKFIYLQKKKMIKLCSNCTVRIYYPSFIETALYFRRKIFEKVTA